MNRYEIGDGSFVNSEENVEVNNAQFDEIDQIAWEAFLQVAAVLNLKVKNNDEEDIVNAQDCSIAKPIVDAIIEPFIRSGITFENNDTGTIIKGE